MRGAISKKRGSPSLAGRRKRKVWRRLNGHEGESWIRPRPAGEGIGEDEGIELIPVTPNRFVVAGTTIVLEFVPCATGRPQELHQTGVGPKPIVSQQLASFATSNEELRTFTGEYTSSELEGTYVLAVRDSRLVIQVAGRADIVLQPIFRDAFAGAVVGVVKFLRTPGGTVTGFTMNTSGVRKMRFDRVKR